MWLQLRCKYRRKYFFRFGLDLRIDSNFLLKQVCDLCLAKQVLQNSDEPSVLRERELTCYQIFKAAEEGDHLALLARERYFAYLGEFLASLCCVTNPGRVVLGGGVSKAGQPLLDGAERYFHKYVFHAASDVKFALASLGNDAGAYGAFKLALDAFGN